MKQHTFERTNMNNTNDSKDILSTELKKKFLLTEEEHRMFQQGTFQLCFQKLGAHPCILNGISGYFFSVWAPNVDYITVAGSFNSWNSEEYYLTPNDSYDIWSGFVPNANDGDLYKYVIHTKQNSIIYKADPYAFYTEQKPATASRLVDISGYMWNDKQWLSRRSRNSHMNRPLNIYEVHLGSWKRHECISPSESNETMEYLTYSELEETLLPYVVSMGYTHIELLPIMEHPFDGSWGYQVTGYYAPTSRYGSPTEFMHFIDACHQAEIGVILDWVPGHFCKDEQGLRMFNGEKLYETYEHPQWGTCRFDFSRGEVRSFLASNLLFWIGTYHIDGIRVDGVTSMLQMNFGIDDPWKKKYNWDGTENDYDAIKFLQDTNVAVSTKYPDVFLIAEESSAWPLVTYPPENGGLGFHYKWDMGWMHDTLDYMKTDFPYRPYNHNLLTFSMMYSYDENFILALSHDEVVHGKCSLIRRMPGDYWRQFAGLRTLAFYQICHPGAKLNFMGYEIGEFIEWRYYEELEWFLLDKFDAHRLHQTYIKTLNHLFKKEKALWQKNYSWDGFEWLDADNASQSILTFIRHGRHPEDDLVILINFTPQTYDTYRIGVPREGTYIELFNTDATSFGGSGYMNHTLIPSESIEWHGKENSISIRVPPIGGVIFKLTQIQS